MKRKIFISILLVNSLILILTGCANTGYAGQSWKTALIAPFEGRGSGDVSGLPEESIQNELSETESDMDNTESFREDAHTEKKLDDTVTFEYVDDTDWVKSEWPDEYAYMKGLDWDKKGDVRDNGNIQMVLEALSVLKDKRPGVSRREIPWESLKDKAESYYGDHIWYAGICLNRIEKIEAGSADSKTVNNGKAYAVLHTSCTPGDEEKEILMYVMNLDNFDSFYSEDDVGRFVNITGWYVGETDGKPSIAYPGLAGG